MMYEGVAENPNPVDLESYLVPYNMDFSLEFIYGKKGMEAKEPEQEADVIILHTGRGAARGEHCKGGFTRVHSGYANTQ